ncbi:MAG TPA: hypothetical protein VFV87_02625, partial [Pirellulaceae bacterium]|nr:hypothetical protein [Pirellulaceae bacterium]
PRPRISAVSDSKGEFQILRHPAPMFLHAKTSNGLLAGLVKIKDDAKEAVIPIGPLAAAKGRLVDGQFDLPVPGRQIRFGFRIEMESGGWTTQFGGTVTTDARGEFMLDGLIPGHSFEVDVVVEEGPDGRPHGWRTVATVTAAKAEVVELGDVGLRLAESKDK